jgi:hypothetical protein
MKWMKYSRDESIKSIPMPRLAGVMEKTEGGLLYLEAIAD